MSNITNMKLAIEIVINGAKAAADAMAAIGKNLADAGRNIPVGMKTGVTEGVQELGKLPEAAATLAREVGDALQEGMRDGAAMAAAEISRPRAAYVTGGISCVVIGGVIATTRQHPSRK